MARVPVADQAANRGRAGLLSTLWIFAVLNYLYCDVLGHMDGAVLAELLRGEAGGMRITQGFLLGAGVLMEVPIAMVLLARVLPQRVNRWANIAAAAVMTAAQAGSLLVGTPTGYYVLYSVIELACTVFIMGYAWTWRPVRSAAPVPVGAAR
ncbi:hypothetical protein Cs7R123_00850 [Catellatospora sp. TT07R-123]|uniref:DUF6326 family protein n=1 Tax=Catellatospora sp. TT07R-123 TaxID=2733863 RepID=UPI001B29F8DA|nr:DUF6326 family protein [Catellatospora sp. TT07R-123]GHJ42743.1 hypothetical protein Cs7R123_00850 [Catellatospora sp. TT07R-123]